MNKITKIITLLTGISILAGVGMADITNDLENAKALYMTNDFAKAQAAYEKVITDYPNAKILDLFHANFMLGFSLARQGNFAHTQIVCESIIENFPNNPNMAMAGVKRLLGLSLIKQGKSSEAQSILIQAALDYGFVSLIHQELCIEKINPAFLEKTEYVNYLEKLLMIVPATEANANFLGRVKSQLEVLK